ncbi:MAG: 2-C-methyl-D-erythritol 4-phosphate cytidylyltransferase [bacterium]
MHVSAIIVAAGRGHRMGGSVPKQFQSICGKPIFYYAVQKFEECTLIDEIVLVAAEDWLLYISQEIVNRFDLKKIRNIVAGGKERQDSVFAGLKALEGPPDLVAIHDAVRPFVSVEKIEETIKACQKYGAAILAVPPKETIKIEKAGFVDRTPSRKSLWSVQTPQIFKYDIIYNAHLNAFEKGVYETDDSALVERFGNSYIKIVKGEYNNIKITNPLDLKLAEFILKTE